MTDVGPSDLPRLLRDMAFWADRATAHVLTHTETSFALDDKAADAVCWCITCVGEAAGAIQRRWPELKDELDLSQAYAMRNRITHGYFAVDLGIVWNVAENYLPRLSAAAREKLATI